MQPTPVQNEQVKPQPLAQAMGKDTWKATPKACGGCQHGATNFTEIATMELLKIVDKFLPIGGDGWNAVQKEYNKFAKMNGQPECDSRSLRQKFDKVSKHVSCQHMCSLITPLVC